METMETKNATARPDRSRRTSRFRLLAVFAILTGAAVLRLTALGQPELWADEKTTYLSIHQGAANYLRAKWAPSRIEQPDPPLPGLLSLFFLRERTDYFREQPQPVVRALFRLPAVLAGLASVWLLIALGTRLAGARTGLFGGVLFAFQIYPLYYSKEGRPYIWMVFFALLTAYAFYRLATHARGAWWAVLFGAALAGGCYSHYMAAWLGPVILTWIIGFGYWISREQYAYQRQFLWRSCGGLLLAAVLFLPWIPAFFRVFDYGTHGLYLIHREGLARILGPNPIFFLRLLGKWTIGQEPFWLALPVLPLPLWGAWRMARSGMKPALFFLLVWLVVPWAIIIWLPGSSMLHHRYLIFGLPAFHLLLAAGLDQGYLALRSAGRKWLRLAAPWLVLALLALLLAPGLRYCGTLNSPAPKCHGAQTAGLCRSFID